MQLQQLRYLLVLAHSGFNVTSAAERLFKSQPSLSKQLDCLRKNWAYLYSNALDANLLDVPQLDGQSWNWLNARLPT